MKIFLSIILACSCSIAQTIPRIVRQVETSAPQDQRIDLRRGETVDLEVKFLNYGKLMDIASASAVLHAQTNGMALSSWQVAGSTYTGGMARVRISVGDWVPSTFSNGWWTLDVVQPDLARVLRASGELRITGMSVPADNIPVPVTWTTNLWNAITRLQEHTNDWDAAYSWGNHSGLYRPIDWVPDEVRQALTSQVAIVAGSVSGPQSNLIASAWQNPSSAAHWTYTTNDGTRVTLTGYDFSSANVVIPDTLSGLPVTGFGTIFKATGITSVSGGSNVTNIEAEAFKSSALSWIRLDSVQTIGTNAFQDCSYLLKWASFKSARTLQEGAFYRCWSMTNIVITSAESLGKWAFYRCYALPLIRLPSASYVGTNAFELCTALNSVIFSQNAIPENVGVYTNSPAVTNYIDNPTATGWGSTWNSRPVIRMPIYGISQNDSDTNAMAHLSIHTNTTLLQGAHGGMPTAQQVGALTAIETSNLVSSSASANFVVRMTAAKTTAFTFQPTNATYIGDCSGSALATNAIVSVLAGTNNQYVAAWGCTNSTFTGVQGTYVNCEVYCYENESGDQQYKLEIYRRDIATDVMSEWGDGGPTFTVPTTIAPSLVSFAVYVPSISTNAFRIWARLKRVGGTATNLRNLYIGTGAGASTHFAMTIPANVPIDTHNADPSAHANRFAAYSAMTITNQLWGADGTNATYRLSWDITNRTFRVQEILP